jgi:predicted AAA+ superfamily ATPase
MSFGEYLQLQQGKDREKELGQQLRQTIFESFTPTNLYRELVKLEPKIRQYFAGVNRLEIDKYLKIGTMPFMLKMNNLGVAYDQMKKTVDTIITKDISQLKKFDAATIDAFPRLIYILTNNDVTSVDKLTNNLGVADRKTVIGMLDVLELTQMVTKFLPFGNRGKQVRKTSKYLFATPVFRAMYLNLLGSTLSEKEIMGKLYEDVVGMYLVRCLTRKGLSYSLTYDSSEGGADFILGLKETEAKIIIEVGSGTKGFAQLEKTVRKIEHGFKYGLTISNSPLALDETKKFVNIPFNYFLLV